MEKMNIKLSQAGKILGQAGGQKNTERQKAAARENWKKAAAAIAQKRASGQKWGGRKKK